MQDAIYANYLYKLIEMTKKQNSRILGMPRLSGGGGRGLLPLMDYRGRLQSKGVPFF